MTTSLVVTLVVLLMAAAGVIAWLVARRAAPAAGGGSFSPSHESVQQAMAAAVAQSARERDVADQAGVRADLERLQQVVQQMNRATSEQFGQVDRSLQVHAAATQSLTATAQGLREALASSNARGQWGERMADDVLRLAGMHEHINYVKRTGLVGDAGGIPDFTFLLPKGHVLFMDVKFPMASYLKYLDATTDAEKAAHRATFVRDVRARVRELATRDYSTLDQRPAVDNVLLFVPNESLAGFIHESDPALIDEAMRQHVVICSPLTLFTFLGIIRQAFDNFMIEQTSRDILDLLGRFGQQWAKYTDQVERLQRQFDAVGKSFDELAGTRRRQLEKPLQAIEELRRRQAVGDDEAPRSSHLPAGTELDDSRPIRPSLDAVGAVDA
ncbi:MAG: DNA recombination protein RmuC [Actinomycetota bacterium]